MIAVDLAEFFTIIMSFCLVLACIAWGRLIWQRQKYAWNVSQDTLVRCRKCGVIYLSPRTEAVSRCSACNHHNRIAKKKAAKRIQY